MKIKLYTFLIVLRFCLLGLLGFMGFLLHPTMQSVSAQTAEPISPEFSLYLSVPEVTPNEKVELIIEANNTSDTPILNYSFQLYLT